MAAGAEWVAAWWQRRAGGFGSRDHTDLYGKRLLNVADFLRRDHVATT
jgi:hypothetical protein